jgi:uncharacterized protein YutE (UPF0331/DUF86 family)
VQDVGFPHNDVEKFALMRSFHIGVECVIDIGNTLIDGFIMRDPGGYSDIIDILEDEQVISTILANELKDFVKLREQLVRKYDEVEEKQLQPFIEKASVFQTFIEQVTLFLEKEKANGNVYVP